MKRPNILLIMSDEHHAGLMGAAGNGIVQTEHLDDLAENGIIFDNCYTPSPICAPARLAFTAGKQVSRCGAWSNESKLASDDIPSIASVLSESGYECYLGGKMHYARDRRYGFDELYTCWTNTNIRKPYKARVTVSEHEAVPEALSGRFEDFRVGQDNRVFGHDREVTAFCRDFLTSRKEEDKPFFLLAGYLAPHFPLIVDDSYYGKYKDRIAMPDLPENYSENQPLHYRIMNKAFGSSIVDSAVTKKGRELYYGLVDWFDDEVGRLLDALKASEVADDTVVIYTSDHGENMGEHGFWWKNTMYDDAAKVPLIVSWPKAFAGGQRRSQVCSLLDLVRTITDLADADVPEDWDGDSLLPIIRDDQEAWRNQAISEYYAHNIAAGHTMIRKDNYKYTYFNRIDDYHGSDCQLFDVSADPGEMKDLSKNPEMAGVIRELHELMVKSLGRDPEEIEGMSREAIVQSHK